LHYGQDDFKTYQNLIRTLSRGESKILAVEFAKARGIDYDINKDIAAKMESKTNFKTYWQDILRESVPIKNTLAQKYLENVGIKDINDIKEMDYKSLKYHEAIWNKESQSHMPGLIAQAIGFNEQNKVKLIGIQITYLNTQTANKENLISPIRYAGEIDNSIIMIQKPNQSLIEPKLQSLSSSKVEAKVNTIAKADNRWFVAVDIESAISIARANPAIRVACLSSLKNFENNPLKGKGDDLIFCVNQDTPIDLIKRAGEVFQDKNFKVHVATPKIARNFCELYKAQEKYAIKERLENAVDVHDYARLKNQIKHDDKEINLIVNHFDELDKKLREAKSKSHYAYTNHAQNNIDEYAIQIGENQKVMQKLQKRCPNIYQRILKIVEKEKEDIIER
jgi:hypothetical protein